MTTKEETYTRVSCAVCSKNFQANQEKVEGVYPRFCFACWKLVCHLKETAIAAGLNVGRKRRSWYKDVGEQKFYDNHIKVLYDENDQYTADRLYDTVMFNSDGIENMDIL